MQTATPMVKSPIRWVGGKHRLASRIIDLLPADAECYVEAFAGAAWVLFGKEPHPVEVLNDANGDLINLYRVLKWRPAELLERVQHELRSRELHDEMKASRPDESDEMARAVWLYMLIRTSFGADVSRLSSTTFGTYKTYKAGESPQRIAANRFLPVSDRLADVIVERSDCCDLIRRYDAPGTVFFCDPPYLDTCGYEESFTLADHERLAASLRGIAGRFLLTINDHPTIRQLYAGCEMVETRETRSKSRSTEARAAAPILFIANYPVPQAACLEAA